MAIDLTLKSVQLNNRDVGMLNSPGNGGVSEVKSVFGHVTAVPAALSMTSVIRLVQVPAHAIIKSIKLHSAAQGAGGLDIGVYEKGVATAVDADFFATETDIGAAVRGTEVMQESGSFVGAK